MSKNIVRFKSLPSTNNYIAKALEEGTFSLDNVILADFQTEGRGQRGNIWQSDHAKNLTFSFAESIDFLGQTNQFLASKAISVALAECLERFLNRKVWLKWPNDLLIMNKKISGILLETKLVDRKKYLIVGIGLNVNQEFFSEGIMGTSMSLIAKENFNLDEVLSSLLEVLAEWWNRLENGEEDVIHMEYMNRLIGVDRSIIFHEPERSFEGKILNVASSGLLSVRSDRGYFKEYFNGDVKLIV